MIVRDVSQTFVTRLASSTQQTVCIKRYNRTVTDGLQLQPCRANWD